MFIPVEKWETRYKQAVADVPQPLVASRETPEVMQGYARRIEAGFADLRAKLECYRPDVLVMVSDDHGEMYDEKACMPSIGLFTGESASGNLRLNFTDPGAALESICLRTHTELANFLAHGLVQRDFDLAVSSVFKPLGIAGGLGHGFTRTAPKVMPNLDIPVIMVLLNCYYEPLPTARRCLALGRAIADVFAERSERIAIFGTGGLSHDPRGPRAGWVDEPLDRAVLAAMAAGKPERLESLYQINSDTYHGGTGEIRAWLVAAAAMGNVKAEVIDYMPIYHAICGVAFASWTPAI
jgi:protocatechuate 4,5-dioxygenase beta chain